MRQLVVVAGLLSSVTVAGAQPTAPRGYALIVGVSDYLHLDQGDLSFPEHDAAAVYRTLLSPTSGDFRAEDVRRLTGSAATLENVTRELAWLGAVATATDRVWIYFSGHGVVSDGEAYLAPYDWDPTRTADTAYPMARLGQFLEHEVAAGRKVLLTDACHSGAIHPRDAATMNDALIEVGDVFALSASAEGQLAAESAGLGHGLFTNAVAEAMRGAADGYPGQARDGTVTAGELTAYVSRTIGDLTGGLQTPTASPGFDREMVLAYDPRQAPPTEALGAVVVTSNLDGVAVFIDDELARVVDRDRPLQLPGLQPGRHTVAAYKQGWEPFGPIPVDVVPNETRTVSADLQFRRQLDDGASDRLEDGVRRFRDGEYDEAIEILEEALAREPRLGEAALYAARAHNALGGPSRQQRARALFEQAIQIDPDRTEARSSFASMLIDVGAIDEAVRQALAVTVLSPDDADAYAVLAQALRIRRSYQEAIDYARRGLGLDPEHANAQYWLADSLRMSEQWEASLAAYDDFLQVSDFESDATTQVLCGILFPCRTSRPSQRDLWNRMQARAHFGVLRRVAQSGALRRGDHRVRAFAGSGRAGPVHPLRARDELHEPGRAYWRPGAGPRPLPARAGSGPRPRGHRDPGRPMPTPRRRTSARWTRASPPRSAAPRDDPQAGSRSRTWTQSRRNGASITAATRSRVVRRRSAKVRSGRSTQKAGCAAWNRNSLYQ